MEIIDNIANLSNIYGISAESVKTVIADILESAFNFRYTVFFDGDNNIRFLSNDTADDKIYSLQDVKRKGMPYSSYKKIRRLIKIVFADTIPNAAASELYARHIYLRGTNVKGVAISKTDKDYIVILNDYNLAAYLPFASSDRNFEFDYGTEYEFNVSGIEKESDILKMTLSRTNKMFVKNIIKRELKIPKITVLYRVAADVSYVYIKEQFSYEEKKRLEILIGERIVSINKISNRKKRQKR
ncbi:MAG: hypothetical protein ACYCTD_04905 [bacterium]